MLDHVRIENFKSIRAAEFDAQRVNVFIGEPNAGKSNVLEALSLLSKEAMIRPADFVRFNSPADLFFDQNLSNVVSICASNWKCTIRFDGNSFLGRFGDEGQSGSSDLGAEFQWDRLGTAVKTLVRSGKFEHRIRSYQFDRMATFPNAQPGELNPPFGDNLVAVLAGNAELRKQMGTIFRAKGFRLQIQQMGGELLIAKETGEELFSFPWNTVSETLRRIVFFLTALETNQNCTLLFDEPEANTFPFYTKQMAERIALDDRNQYFLTTHNPYLLSALVEKTPIADLAVFVTRMENYETRVQRVPDEQLSELLELGVDTFFNLGRLVPE